MFTSIAMLYTQCSYPTRPLANEKPLSLNVIDTITLYLDNWTPNTFGNIVYNSFDSLLYAENRQNYSIDKFDLISGELVSRVKVPQEGPFQINIMQGFSVFPNSDSLAIFELRMPQRAIIHSTSGFSKLFSDQLINALGQEFINHLSVAAAPTFIADSNIYFQQWPLINLNDVFQVARFNDILEIDLNNDKIEYFSAPNPKYYNSGRYFGAQGLVKYRTMASHDKYIISYGLCDSIYVFSPHSHEVRSYLSTSHKAYPKYTGAGRPRDVPDYDTEYINTALYVQCYYDPYRKLIHRLMLLPTHGNFDYLESLQRRSVLIITHDSTMTIVAETKLGGSTYNIDNIFVSPHGLCIPTTNKFNPESKEDEIDFLVFGNR